MSSFISRMMPVLNARAANTFLVGTGGAILFGGYNAATSPAKCEDAAPAPEPVTAVPEVTPAAPAAPAEERKPKIRPTRKPLQYYVFS